MSEVESNFDALYRRPDFLNENNSLRNLLDTATQTIESSVTTTNQDRNNNNLLAKKRRLRKFKRIKALQNKQKKYKIVSTTKLSLPSNTLELPWDDITLDDDDDENPQRHEIKLQLLLLRTSIACIDLDITDLQLKKIILEISAREHFDRLAQLPVEVSTDASSGEEKG
jgi:hypothetical protein